MSAQERKVKNVTEYLEQVSRIKKQWRNSVLAFRGQEDESWGSESSAERRLKNSISQDRVTDQLFIEYHKNQLEKCKLKNYDKREGKPLNELELLADLRHYGAATCLIDFTRNALVALWFACEKTGSADSDGKVFVVNTADEKVFLAIAPPDIENQSIEEILRFKTRKTDTDEDQVKKYQEPGTFETSQDKPNFWYWTPAHLNERITAQRSLFLFGLPSVSEQLPSEKIIIESESKAQIRQELKAIHDIHEESLFPDFVGFAYTQRHNAPYYVFDAEEYFRRGVEAHQRGDFDLAVQDYDEAIALKPDNAEAYCNRGVTYGEKGDFDLAVQDFDKAIALKPDHAQAYNNRGVAYAEKGEFARAIQDYDKAIGLKPDLAETYDNRGVAYAKKGEFARAIQDFDKTIDLKPDDAEAYNNRGYAYRKKGDLDRATQDYKKAIDLKPDDAKAYYNRSVAWLILKEWDKARSDLIAAKSKGVDSAKPFSSAFGSVSNFEQKYNVQLPDDIAEMLTP